MAGRTTVACTQEQYKTLITTIFNGVDGIFEPNPRIATALQIAANTGLRIGDVLRLTMNSFIKDGENYRFDIIEEKTSKKRNFIIPDPVYNLLVEYSAKLEIGNDDLLFSITEREVQKHLLRICKFLGNDYRNISSHSFRKMFAMNCYKNSGCDIDLVCALLQHSSTSVTRRYLGLTDKKINEALINAVNIV